LLNPDAEPKITDYNVWNEDGDFTEETFNGAKLMVLFSDVNKSRFKKISDINKLVDELKSDVESWVITANDEATYENFRHEYQIALPYYYADGTVIKAMIRANPGLILMKDGIVLGKWHNNDIPSKDEVIELLN
ncbi:MAG: DoxX family protein, partial [Cyclobacteriaceae bacterium]|nr:DoxX family protein [Cyclobacteriaceae bacterium]